jgi:hypothetical protein
VTADLDPYRNQLVIALRMRNVPADRIGEAVAEVESHVADTGEDPVTAFGEPADYAKRLTETLDRRASPVSRWLSLIVAAVSFAAFGVATTGLLHGDPAPVAVAVGVLIVMGVWLYRRRAVDRIVDPRTGATLRLPASRWALAVLAVSVAALVVVAAVVAR